MKWTKRRISADLQAGHPHGLQALLPDAHPDLFGHETWEILLKKRGNGGKYWIAWSSQDLWLAHLQHPGLWHQIGAIGRAPLG